MTASDWQEGEPREPRPLRIAPQQRRPWLDAEDRRELVKIGVKVGAVTLAVLWTAFVLGMAAGTVRLSFCVLAGCLR